jgi:hypothetical protein
MSTRFASAEQYRSIDEVRDAYPGAADLEVWRRQR